MIKKIETILNLTHSGGLLHDSRTDYRNLAKVCIELIKKVNELTDKINKIEKAI